MALQTSGAISLNDMHVEAGGTTGTQVSLNEADIRDLISKASGAQMTFAEWYGASADSGVTEMLGGTSDDFAHITGSIDAVYGGESGSNWTQPSDYNYAPRWSANDVIDPSTDQIGYQRYSRGDRSVHLSVDKSNNRLRCRTPNTLYSDADNDGTTCFAMITLNRFLPGYYRIEGNGLTPNDSNCPSQNTIYVYAFDDSFNTVSPTDSYGARELTDSSPVLLGNANIPAGTTDRGFNFTVTSGNQNLVLIVKCYYAPTIQNGVTSSCRSGITNLDIYEDTP